MPNRTDREFNNLFWLALIALVEGFCVLILAAWVLSRIPLKPELGSLYPIYQQWLHPERDIALYRVFVFSVISIYTALLAYFRHRLADPGLVSGFKRYLIVQTGLLFMVCFAVFKIFVYAAPVWAVHSFQTLVVLTIFTKLAWSWTDHLIIRAVQWLDRYRGLGRLRWVADLGIVGILFSLLFIPDLSCAVAKIYSGDAFLHVDNFIMAPGWAVLKGGRIYVEHYSQYGMGFLNMIAGLSQMMNGFTYHNVLRILVLITIVYFMLIYSFLRLWFRNIALAGAGVFLAIKCQIFSHGPDDFIWQFPMSTVVRYCFDILLFILILMHLRSGKKVFLAMAGIVAGVGLFYITDSGMFMLVSFYAYVFVLWLLPSTRDLVFRTQMDIFIMLGYFLLPVGIFLSLLLVFIGHPVTTALFWQNAAEQIQFVTNGLNAVAVMDNLKNRHFVNFFLGIVVALTYVFTLVFVVGLSWFGRTGRENLMAVVLSVYGLCSYHYYVLRSTATAFLTVSIPFALILIFWFRCFIENFDERIQRRMRIMLALLVIFGLLTTHSFLKYPHVFNPDRSACSQEKQYMQGTFISDEDVDLIRRLTKATDRVCLISSFETATLIAADRKPFFYTFNLVHSRAMNTREFGGWKLITPHQFNRMMAQLTGEAPQVVFIERRLISEILPEVYLRYYATLKHCVDYLKAYYQPVEEGKYLVALKHI